MCCKKLCCKEEDFEFCFENITSREPEDGGSFSNRTMVSNVPPVLTCGISSFYSQSIKFRLVFTINSDYFHKYHLTGHCNRDELYFFAVRTDI